jgi:hypothetical protein
LRESKPKRPNQMQRTTSIDDDDDDDIVLGYKDKDYNEG